MAKLPKEKDLADSLAAAGRAHHQYEQTVLNGIRNAGWSGFYTAFIVGRLGDFATASELSRLSEEVTDPLDWSGAAARDIIASLSNQ